ncbi:MAG: hypothetical protein U0X87_05080 [Anaerolineales bacterium]
MNSGRKYFGMTIPQLGVLAGLAGALFLILCVGGWLILGGGVNTASPQQIPTAIEPTVTLAAPPTATFTPMPTAIPYEQLIPQGWKQQRTDLVEIWLPSDYRQTTIKDLVILDDQMTLELSLARTLTKKHYITCMWLLATSRCGAIPWNHILNFLQPCLPIRQLQPVLLSRETWF